MDFAIGLGWFAFVGGHNGSIHLLVLGGMMEPQVSLGLAPVDLAARCLLAAQSCDLLDQDWVCMLDTNSTDARALRSILQSLGLDVFNSTNWYETGMIEKACGDEHPVIMIPSSDWRRADFKRKAKTICTRMPEAIICVVTGETNAPDVQGQEKLPEFSDARALLQSAGISFFSYEGFSNELCA